MTFSAPQITVDLPSEALRFTLQCSDPLGGVEQGDVQRTGGLPQQLLDFGVAAGVGAFRLRGRAGLGAAAELLLESANLLGQILDRGRHGAETKLLCRQSGQCIFWPNCVI